MIIRRAEMRERERNREREKSNKQKPQNIRNPTACIESRSQKKNRQTSCQHLSSVTVPDSGGQQHLHTLSVSRTGRAVQRRLSVLGCHVDTAQKAHIVNRHVFLCVCVLCLRMCSNLPQRKKRRKRREGSGGGE